MDLSSELMLLGFISLLLTATSSTIANICISSKFYDSNFAPCTRSEIDQEIEENSSEGRKLLMLSILRHSLRRRLNGLDRNTCKEACLQKKLFLHINHCLVLPAQFSNALWRSKELFYCTGTWTICVISRSWAIASLHLRHGNHTYILQLLDNVAGNCEGNNSCPFAFIVVDFLTDKVVFWWKYCGLVDNVKFFFYCSNLFDWMKLIDRRIILVE